MMAFWLICAGMISAALAFILSPLRRPRRIAVRTTETTAAAYRRQFTDMEQELRNGAIDAGQFQLLCDELHRRLLSEHSESGKADSQKRVVYPAALVYGLAAGTAIAVVILYRWIGSPP